MSKADETQFDGRPTRELMRVTRIDATSRSGGDPPVLGVEFEVQNGDLRIGLRRGDRLSFSFPTSCESGERFVVLARGPATRIDRGVAGEPVIFRVLAEVLSRSPRQSSNEQSETSFTESADRTSRLLSETLHSLERVLLQRPEYALQSEAVDFFSRIRTLLSGASVTSSR